MAIQFVGGVQVNSTGTANYTVSLTSLTGGIASQPILNDLVVICHGWKSTTNDDPAIASFSAYVTEVADLYSNGTNDANMSLSYFFVDSDTSSTSFFVNTNGSTTGTKSTSVAVFRGVLRPSPLDATTTTATGSGNGNPNPPAITPVTTGAWLVCAGLVATGGSLAGSFTSPPSTFTMAATGGTAGTDISFSGIAYKSNPTIGSSNDPGAFTGSVGGANATWCVATMALIPSSGNVKVWDGSAWRVNNVKVRTAGGLWIIEPVKHWNGSAWVKTNY